MRPRARHRTARSPRDEPSTPLARSGCAEAGAKEPEQIGNGAVLEHLAPRGHGTAPLQQRLHDRRIVALRHALEQRWRESGSTSIRAVTRSTALCERGGSFLGVALERDDRLHARPYDLPVARIEEV